MNINDSICHKIEAGSIDLIKERPMIAIFHENAAS